MFALAMLVVLLIVMKREAQAPWFTAGVLIIITQFRKSTRWNWTKAGAFFAAAGRLLAGLVPLLAAVGMLVGSLFVTGTAASITSDLVHLSEGNLAIMLIMGAVISFVLGTGLPGSAAYIFLGIMLAPALVKQGLNPLAVHIFLLYWANLADVTPPTAISVVAAAGVAGSPVMKTMMEAMRLASIKYLLPFFMILSPALVLQDSTLFQVVVEFVIATIGITIIAYAMQGYMLRVGTLSETIPARVLQVILLACSISLIVPDFNVRAVALVLIASVYVLLITASRMHWTTLVAAPAGTQADPAVLVGMQGAR
jgi:TRAP-type uncharacterized transport system fused permease subunit